MEIKNILKSCMELGLVKFKIKGVVTYPRTLRKNTSGSEFLIDGRYSCSIDDLKLISIDTERIKKITEVFNFLLEFNEDGIDLNDLSKISSLLILKNLKELDNDVERAEYLRKHLDTEHTLLQDLVTNSEENEEEIEVDLPYLEESCEEDEEDEEELSLDDLFDDGDNSHRSFTTDKYLFDRQIKDLMERAIMEAEDRDRERNGIIDDTIDDTDNYPF
tara:strand:- start:11636 stop:12289 length:654 start_codon:yes stop_codon:yes gene_type:complete